LENVKGVSSKGFASEVLVSSSVAGEAGDASCRPDEDASDTTLWPSVNLVGFFGIGDAVLVPDSEAVGGSVTSVAKRTVFLRVLFSDIFTA
jgi:hypothetical protein